MDATSDEEKSTELAKVQGTADYNSQLNNNGVGNRINPNTAFRRYRQARCALGGATARCCSTKSTNLILETIDWPAPSNLHWPIIFILTTVRRSLARAQLILIAALHSSRNSLATLSSLCGKNGKEFVRKLAQKRIRGDCRSGEGTNQHRVERVNLACTVMW